MVKFRKLPELAYRTINGKAYIVNPKDSTLHELNETGTFIWELLESPAGEKEISAKLAAEYRIPRSKAREDAVKFLSSLKRKKLLATTDE
ncbi:MAG: PqqD family protein [Elusimicrobiota bacterium]